MGDPTKGGNQTLKEKMNLADQEASVENLEDIASARGESTPAISDQINAVNNQRGSSAGQSSIPGSLPEDNEIEEL